MDTREDLRAKIKFLQKKIDQCQDDAEALLLQSQMIDFLKTICQDKELLKEILLKNGNN